MKLVSKVILIFMLSFSFNATAQVDRRKAPEPGPTPKVNIDRPALFQLDNGLTVLVMENHKLPMVTVSLKFDRDPVSGGDKVGLQNLFGSMLRAGTKNRSKEEFDEAIDQLGTTFFASSSEVHLSTLRQYLEESIKLMCEALLAPAFDNSQELQRLIKQAIIRIEMEEKNSQVISERVQQILYYGKAHPYGEYESRESLENITLEDLKKFYQTYFKPNAGYLVFVGDITQKEAKQLADRYFSAWEKGKIPDKKYAIAPSPVQLEVTVVDLPSITQSNISVGGPVKFKKNAPDYFAAFLANGILGRGAQSRLFQNLREQKAYTYGAYSSLNPDKHIGMFSAFAQVRTEVTGNAVAEFIKELQRIINVPVSVEELDIKKKESAGQFVLGLENPMTIAEFAVSELSESLPIGFYQNYLKNLQAVTLPQVMVAAKKYIPVKNARILVVGQVEQILPQLKKLAFPIRLVDKYGNPIPESGQFFHN